MRGKELDRYKRNLSLSEQQINVVVGTLLGDSTLSIIKPGIKTCNIKFEQKISNKEYIYKLYSIFNLWCGTEPKVRNIKNLRQSIYFKTYRHKCFVFYYNKFYTLKMGKRVKVIPKLMSKWINAEVLAYWFMDDGSKTQYGYVLHTQNYSFSDQKYLVKVLKENLNLKVSIQKDKNMFFLYINAESKDLFTMFVKPYIVNCMLYKLHNL